MSDDLNSRPCYNLTLNQIIGNCDLKVNVKLFARYKEIAGKSNFDIDLPNGSTVGFLVKKVLQHYPEFIKKPENLVVAVNEEYSEHQFTLSDGDDVALIPPVSGGFSDRNH